jgi:hypothetical protein
MSSIEYTWLLPLLTGPFVGAAERLGPLMESRGWSPSRSGEVSLERLVLTGLEVGSELWFGAAVKWLEEGFPVTAEIAHVIHERRSDASLPQMWRQSAFAIIRRWEKSMDACTR